MNFLTARWQNLIMANYVIDPGILQPYLPSGTELDFFEGETFVSLVGFLFTGTRLFGIPIPGFGNFEEINLRFYVIRRTGDRVTRGVVFINETVPYRAIAWLANLLYREHYSVVPTKHHWMLSGITKDIGYHWKLNGRWNVIQAIATNEKEAMPAGGIAEFIFEHYYGYTRISKQLTEEYRIEHDRWDINAVIDFKIDCDFEAMYGKAFAGLSGQNPSSVLLAEGSPIAVNLKRIRL